MALRYAVANGNWSNTATWDGGTLPTSADDVYANNFTVTIDQDITVLSLRNAAGAPAVAGGIFILTNGITVNATGTGLVNNGSTLIDFTLASPNSATVTSTNISGVGGPPNTFNAPVRLSGTGTLTLNSNWLINNSVIAITDNGVFNLNGSGGHVSTVTTQPGMRISAISATLNWVGNLTFVGTNTWAYISNNGSPITSTVNMTGNLIGSDTQSAFGIATNGVLNVTGTVSPAPISVLSAFAISGGVGSTITVNGIISSNSNRVLAISSTGLTTISGQVICVNESPFPVQSTRLRLSNSLNTQMTFQTDVSGVDKTLYEPGTDLGNPAVTDVRNGVTYAGGALTGSLVIPPSGSVALGVPVDNTVGTAMISITDMGALLASYIV
jgi:hypothetical protein